MAPNVGQLYWIELHHRIYIWTRIYFLRLHLVGCAGYSWHWRFWLDSQSCSSSVFLVFRRITGSFRGGSSLLSSSGQRLQSGCDVQLNDGGTDLTPYDLGESEINIFWTFLLIWLLQVSVNSFFWRVTLVPYCVIFEYCNTYVYIVQSAKSFLCKIFLSIAIFSFTYNIYFLWCLPCVIDRPNNLTGSITVLALLLLRFSCNYGWWTDSIDAETRSITRNSYSVY